MAMESFFLCKLFFRLGPFKTLFFADKSLKLLY